MYEKNTDICVYIYYRRKTWHCTPSCPFFTVRVVATDGLHSGNISTRKLRTLRRFVFGYLKQQRGGQRRSGTRSRLGSSLSKPTQTTPSRIETVLYHIILHYNTLDHIILYYNILYCTSQRRHSVSVCGAETDAVICGMTNIRV